MMNEKEALLVKKPRIPLVRPAQLADVHHSRGKKDRITLDRNL